MYNCITIELLVVVVVGYHGCIDTCKVFLIASKPQCMTTKSVIRVCFDSNITLRSYTAPPSQPNP